MHRPPKPTILDAIPLALLGLGALALSACTAQQLQREAVRAEKILDAKVSAWDQHFHAVYDACEAAHPDKGPERDACVAEVDRIDDAVGHVVTAAVAAGRAFWLGMAVGEDPTALRAHVTDLVTAVSGFPVEALDGIGGGR